MPDVVVVGGGPAGSHAASLLGEQGLDVHVLEEHQEIGAPVDCSGVIGAESFETLALPNSLKLAEIRTVTLVSPSQLEVCFSPPAPLAHIVDRAAFDQAIAEKSTASGVTLHLGSRVVDLQVLDGCVEVVCRETGNRLSAVADRRKLLKASMVILAGGPRYKFQRKLGMGAPEAFLRTAQTEVRVRDVDGTKVLMGSQVAPGSFAWVVPFRREKDEFARIGVSAKTNAAPYLARLLKQLYSKGYLDSPKASVRSWVIPLTPIRRTFAERVVAVGDAAGQTKPTTGGGIFYGLLCAEAAARTAAAAFKDGDFSAASMSRYEKEWRRRLGAEIKLGAFFRRLAERLSDEEIDSLFRAVQSDGILSAVTSRARFDWHRDVIRFSLRHPVLGRIFLKGLFR